MALQDVIVEIERLEKTYRLGEVEVPVLRGVDLTVQRGAFHAVLGPSGCGKTTLLNLIGTLDTPSAGRIAVGGRDISSLDEAQRTLYRRDSVGFVFQFFNLLPLLTALENVELGLEALPGLGAEEVRTRSAEMLEQVGLASDMRKFPSQLSGGQQQRVAIARALAKQPAIVLCDEPTGNLDARTSRQVVDLMREINAARNATFVIVTHDPDVARNATAVTHLLDGQVHHPEEASAKCTSSA